MKKQEFMQIMSEIEPDEFMKQRIERKVLSMDKKQEPSKKIHFRKVAVLAVCIAVVCGTGASFPVMAEHIPALKNALNYLTSNETYIKDPIAKNDAMLELAETVEITDTDEDADITFSVQDVYYDDNDVIIYYAFETNGDELKKYNGITSRFFRIFADGKELTFPENEIMSSGQCDENTYAGMLNFPASYLDNAENVNLRIDMHSLELSDSNTYYFNYDADNPCYEYAKPEVISVDISCSFNISKINNVEKIYEINQSKNDITLNSVTITPVRTHIDFTDMVENRNYAWTLTDNNGNEIQFINKNDFDTPLKNATSLTLKFLDLNADDLTEVCSFTFDIDGGYRSDDIYSNQQYNRENLTFIPSEEEVDKWIEEHKTKLHSEDVGNITPFNTYKDYNYEAVEGRLNNFSMKISNIEYLTNINELDLKNCGYSPYEMFSEYIDENGNIDDEYTLVILDYTIKSNEDVNTTYGLTGGISRVDNVKECISYEIAYLDVTDNGGKSKFFYNFKPYEERTVRVGRLVDSTAVKDGIIHCVDHGNYYDLIALE